MHRFVSSAASVRNWSSHLYRKIAVSSIFCASLYSSPQSSYECPMIVECIRLLFKYLFNSEFLEKKFKSFILPKGHHKLTSERVNLGYFFSLQLSNYQADVTLQWAYGVTVWEVFTAGSIPYPGLHPREVLDSLESGHRLKRPKNMACCPNL